MPSSETPSASTASRPALLTLRNAPLVGRDGAEYRIIRIFGKAEYFCRGDLTSRPDKVFGTWVICPTRHKVRSPDGAKRNPGKRLWRSDDPGLRFAPSGLR